MIWHVLAYASLLYLAFYTGYKFGNRDRWLLQQIHVNTRKMLCQMRLSEQLILKGVKDEDV